MRKILVTATAATIAAATLLVPGNASAQEAGALATCDPDKHVRISVQKRGNFIDGLGGFFNCDQATTGYTIKLQEKRFIGWYDHVVRSGVWRTNHYAVTTYTCEGTKSKTWRALINSGIGTKAWVKTSKSITVPCG
ncbi:hypothetical protein [Allokutzneria albata]|uniref:Uncharacterized protein n=1 Tax=Allokutzneria albata TaxID=211114 RepID=A0A1G9VMN7_ALLAB|nr:hypothetical protein [Allokutzneria albata]SDM73518.1 hypothetical protein SAMN04489726_3130 [Allokutzneria albata]